MVNLFVRVGGKRVFIIKVRAVKELVAPANLVLKVEDVLIKLESNLVLLLQLLAECSFRCLV
jgi:hypothetical protein